MKDMWDERYRQDKYFYGENPNNFLKSVYGILPSRAKVLCVADGEGRNGVFLAEKGCDVSAVDYSVQGRKKALDLANSKNVHLSYELSDLNDYDFGHHKWDAVISIFCHLPTESRVSIHQKIQHALKPGGIFILEAYHPKQLSYQTGGPKDLSMLYTQEMLLQDFRLMKWIKLENSEKEVFEGIGHTGLSSVVDAVGMKMTGESKDQI